MTPSRLAEIVTVHRKWLRAAKIVGYNVVIVAVLLEILLRLFDPIGIEYISEAHKYFQGAMTESDEFAYIHTAGYSAELQGVEVTINSEGLRSPEFPVMRPDGEKRLLLLGDSVVFGWGAPQDSITSAWLQRHFDVEAPEWRVIGAGVGSWNTRNEYEFLRSRGLAYGLDAVALLIVSNDVEPKRSGRTALSKDELFPETDELSQLVAFRKKVMRGLASYSYLVATYGFILKKWDGGQVSESLYESDHPAWLDVADALDSMINLCRANDIELIVFIYGQDAPGASRAYIDAYSQYFDAAEVPYEVFSDNVYDTSYRNSIVDGHPNGEGHGVIAAEMFEVLRDRLIRTEDE